MAVLDAQPRTIETPRRTGRPRSKVSVQVLGAVIDELCETGVAGTTVERIAATTGIAKTTIYRRWSNKVELIVDAIDLLRDRSPVPDTGNLRADLEAGLDNMIRTFTSREGRAIAAVYVARLHLPDLAAAWQTKIGGPHMASFRRVLQRGVDEGHVRLTLGVDETLAVLTGIAFMVLVDPTNVSPGTAAGVVSTVIDGISVP